MEELVAKYAGAYDSEFEAELSEESTDVETEDSTEESMGMLLFSTLLTGIRNEAMQITLLNMRSLPKYKEHRISLHHYSSDYGYHKI